MKYFKKEEFKCNCGVCKKGFEEMQPELLEKLDEARDIAGIPFIIYSGYRCKKYNDWVGGSPTSRHMKGEAVDIKADTSRNRYLILDALFKVGFTSIGIYKGFIHADISNRRFVWRK